MSKKKSKRNRRVAILTPAYGGMIHVQNAQSVANALFYLRENMTDVGWIHYGNVASNTKARNALVAQALEQGFDDLVFIDGDIAFPPDSLMRLLSHDVDLVGGVPKGNIAVNPDAGFPYVVQPLPTETGELRFDVEKGLAKVASVTTSFFRLRAPALKEFITKVPELKYHDSAVVGTDNYLYALFHHRLYQHPDPKHKDKMAYQGEDYSFCWLWRQHGYDVYADLHIPLRHIKTVSLDGTAIVDLMKSGRKGPHA